MPDFMQEQLQKVMLVEDNADIRTIARVALEKIGGLSVLACESGAEGLAAVEAFQPQLILLDVMMPGLDGPAVLKQLRDQPATAQIPIVFLTAKMSPQDSQMLRGLGALDIIGKPF